MTFKKFLLVANILLVTLLFISCKQEETEMKDGFYTAEMSDYDDFGWKEYVTLYITNDTIITVDYNAKNASGFIKSWDMEYMRVMNASDKTYPNKYTREYAEALLKRQNPEDIDAITGATHSHVTFQALTHAAMEQAKSGNKNVVFVDTAGDTGE